MIHQREEKGQRRYLRMAKLSQAVHYKIVERSGIVKTRARDQIRLTNMDRTNKISYWRKRSA